MKFYCFKLLKIFWGWFSPSTLKDQVHKFSGTEMTLDYQIIIGSELSSAEQHRIQEIIWETFREVNNLYNKWNPQSEISALNRLKANQKVFLSAELEHFLFLTNEIVKLTNGKFDPTIEPLQKLWKECLEKNSIPSENEIEGILPAIGWHHLHFGGGEFYKDHDLTKLDLGGIAKGYCVDLLVERIVEAGFKDVFVEWEGEIRANGMHPEKRPWNVLITRLEDPDPNHAILHVNLENRSVATSGDYIQYWKMQKEGAEVIFFHIIDPVTGIPLISTQKSVASATIVAPTCILADALASVAMMYPTIEESRVWAKEMRQKNPKIQCWVFSREELKS